jgi:hypothetical protein
MAKAVQVGIIGTALMMSFMTVALAESDYRGTAAQRRACRPDVFRFCAAEIPNVRAITRCLARQVSRLSAPCRAVFQGKM